MGREFQARAWWLQGPGGFQGKVTQLQEPGRAASTLGLWCWWPRLGLPSRAKKGQHCSAWVLLPQPQMTRVQCAGRTSPHRTGLVSLLMLWNHQVPPALGAP